MERQAGDWADALTQETVVVADQTQLFAVEIHDFDALILRTTAAPRLTLYMSAMCGTYVAIKGA